MPTTSAVFLSTFRVLTLAASLCHPEIGIKYFVENLHRMHLRTEHILRPAACMFFKRFRRSILPDRRPATDGEFVAAYQATGDLETLGELYERHIDMVYAVCYNYLRDEAESQDAVMHLFEQLITDLKRHEVQNFRSWLHTVARNYCLMQLRARRVYVSDTELTDEDDDGARPTINGLITEADSDGPDLEYHIEQMHACLKTLPAAQQNCLDLFYLQQKSYAEVAQLTGYDIKQVKSYLQNGRRNLKLCLERRHDD